MQVAQFTVRPAEASDSRAMAELFAAVAGERTGIATEPPVDIDGRAAQFAHTALVQAAISRARDQGLHKLCLEVFAHNTAAIALYRKSGFVAEGQRIGQYRRASGELWDSTSWACRYSGAASPITSRAAQGLASRAGHQPGRPGPKITQPSAARPG